MQIVENTPNEEIEDEEENNFVRENRYADTHTYVMNNEISVLIKILAEKYDNNQNKSFITIESFAKVVPDFDGYSIPVQQWIHNINENAEVRNKIHKMLQNRKKRGSENVHEYIIQMRKIAALGQIEDKSIISYIVDGLEVRDDLKYPLYSTCTFSRYELMLKVDKNNAVNKYKKKTKREKSSNNKVAKNNNNIAIIVDRMNIREQNAKNRQNALSIVVLVTFQNNVQV